MHVGGSITFQPTPEAIDHLLDSLGDPSASIASLARQNNTTAETLCAWMSTPDIAQRLAESNNIITWRTRLTASNSLTTVVATLNTILKGFNTKEPLASARGTSPESSATSPPRDNFRSLLLNWRTAESARKSCTLLLRLANINPIGLPRDLRDQTSPAPAAPRITSAATRATRATPATAIPEEPLTPQSPNTNHHESTDSTSRTPEPAPPRAPTSPLSPPPSPFEPPSPKSREQQLEDFLFDLLGEKPHLEPALTRFVSELHAADAALTARPP